MKTVLVASILSIGVSASAANVFVHPNVYLASGPATANYFSNLGVLQTEFSKVSSAELGKLTFNGASVKDDGSVVYTFHRFESESAKEVCWSSLTFTRSGSEQAPVVSDVQAELSCTSNQD
ncbi:hypothetical protein [Bdellovibrio reynosensis]|uniref:Uncharacterized protein n=1 Tax=Bdellovibrio reynosensis TaxID=2835041 RepID=A0ABY4CD43_9BACT|nr:hypothetical protein [Bdellovibrio reynosensis]UOF02369.1 hypothetical protein MNR06_05320 [Bdellovibrio reynosensis]